MAMYLWGESNPRAHVIAVIRSPHRILLWDLVLLGRMGI